MAAPTLIKITSASFKGVDIVSAIMAQIDIAGSEQQVRGGGVAAMQASYVEGIHGKVSVQANQGNFTDGQILPGNGALVIVGFTQADGSGAAGGGAKTWTFPNATLTNSGRSLPQDGNPQVSLNFTCVAASGDPADIFAIS